MRRAYAQSAAERQQAEEDGLALRDRVRASYPFHPALIDLMRERWAAIPDFQRTRGALRFLASCLRRSTGKARAGPSWGRATCRSTIPKSGWPSSRKWASSPTSRRCWSMTSLGPTPAAKRVDDRRAKENPAEAIRRPAITAGHGHPDVFVRRPSAGRRRRKADVLPPGVTEAELLSVCVGPDLDSTTALACLKELKEQCLYLHFDGARYCFKKDPNVTLLIEQEAEAVGRNDKQVRTRVKEMIEARLAGHRNAIVWPENAADIPDRDPSFLIAYLPPELGGKPRSQQERSPRVCLRNVGEKPRTFRNGLGLAIPAGDQVEILRRAVRYLIAAEGVKGKAKQLNLTDEQKGQLRERESTEHSGRRVGPLEAVHGGLVAAQGRRRHWAREGRCRRPPAPDHAERQEAGDDPGADRRADHDAYSRASSTPWRRTRSSSCSASAKERRRRSASAPARSWTVSIRSSDSRG